VSSRNNQIFLLQLKNLPYTSVDRKLPLKVLGFHFDNDIILCRLPSRTSRTLQPGDVVVFAPVKAAYHCKADRIFQRGAKPKEHFTSLYNPDDRSIRGMDGTGDADDLGAGREEKITARVIEGHYSVL